MGILWRKFLLIWVLSFQLAFAPAIVYAQENPAGGAAVAAEPDPFPIADLLNREVSQGDVVERVAYFEKLASMVEAGGEGLETIPAEKFDAFHLRGQFLEILDNEGKVTQRFDLARSNVGIPPIPHTATSVRAVPEENKLYIEALRGGVPVARHVFENVDAVAAHKDAELLFFMDSRGGMHVIDMAFASQNAFRNIVPIFQNVFPGKDGFEQPGTPKIRIITRGLKPILGTDNIENYPGHERTVIPRGPNGKVILQAGDAVAYFEKEDGERVLHGVFNRTLAHTLVQQGTEILVWLSFLVAPQSIPKELHSTIAGFAETPENRSKIEMMSQTMPPEIRSLLLALGPDQLQGLLSRVGQNESLSSRNNDKMTLEQWISDFTDLREEARRQARPDLSDLRLPEEILAEVEKVETVELEAWATRRHSELRESDPALAAHYEKIRKAADKKSRNPRARLLTEIGTQGDLTEEWRNLIPGEGSNITRLEATQPSESYTRKNSKKEGTEAPETLARRSFMFRALTGDALKTLAITAATGFGVMQIPGSQELVISMINAVISDFHPELLTEAKWRTPLIGSVVSLMSFIPLAMIMSVISAPLMKTAGRVLGDTSAGRKMREMGEKWGELTVWQRIVSSGMRIYGTIMIPFWNLIVRVINQPNLLQSLKLGQNPLRRITPESEIGKEAGLERTVRLGVNIPYKVGLSEEPLTLPGIGPTFRLPVIRSGARTQEQDAALSALERQRLRAESLAWTLASVTVGQSRNVDPATIMALGTGAISVDEIVRILHTNNPGEFEATDAAKDEIAKENARLRQTWQRVAEGIAEQLKKTERLGLLGELDSISPEALAEYIRIAREVCDQVQSQGELASKLTDLKRGFQKTLASKRRAIIDWGKKDSAFLRSVFSNEFVTKQVQQEFTWDHVAVVLIPAVFGGRADIHNPKELTFDARGPLWTNPEHLYSIGLNTMAHFFAAGAAVSLVYQGRPQVQETNYQPVERITERSRLRREGMFFGTMQWLRNTFDFTKSDIGMNVVRFYQKRIATFQAAMLMQIATRHWVAGADWELSVTGSLMTWMVSGWWFGWIWFFTQGGNKVEGERLQARNERFMEVKIRLSQALKLEASEAEIREAYSELLRFYQDEGPGRRVFRALGNALGHAERVLDVNKKDRLSGRHTEIEATRIETQSEETRLLENRYLGALVRLATAVRNGNRNEMGEARLDMIQIYQDSGRFDERSLLELNAYSLLELAKSDPPIHTHKSRLPSQLAIIAAVVLSTVWAVSLGIASFDRSYMSRENFVKNAGITLGYIAGSGVLMSGWFYRFLGRRIKAMKQLLTAEGREARRKEQESRKETQKRLTALREKVREEARTRRVQDNASMSSALAVGATGGVAADAVELHSISSPPEQGPSKIRGGGGRCGALFAM